MQMRPQIQLKSVITALSDVVLPAVDPNNKLAQEQAKLAIGLLTLMGQQLPMQHQFDRDELERLLDTAERLRANVRGGEKTASALAELDHIAQSGSKVLIGTCTPPKALEESVRALRKATGEVITQARHDGDPGCRVSLREIVLSMTKEQLTRDRSMLLMQGWEPDPDAVPPLSSLLAPATALQP
jgi:hypothetical protein